MRFKDFDKTPKSMKNTSFLKLVLPCGLYIGMLWTLFSCGSSSAPQDESTPLNKNQMKTEKLIIGTYTSSDEPNSKGIYRATRDLSTGKLTFDSLLLELDNPNFQAVSKDGQFLYTVSETTEDGGMVYAFRIEPDLSLTYLNHQSSLGRSACHVAVNQAQTMLFVANYSTGVFTMYHLEDDGSISGPVDHYKYEGSGPHPNQGSSHPHQTTISPDQNYVYVPDLGTDQIHMYQLDAQNKRLTELNPATFELPPGSGPRHMTFHPNRPYAYAINELRNTVQAMHYDAATGLLTGIDLYSTLPEDFSGESYCADIHLSPDGKFLYGSNRGHNSLVIYRIDESTGQLERVGFTDVYGYWPRNFYIAPDGKFVYVANERSGNISSYSRDEDSGELTLLDSAFTAVVSPVCITPFEE